MLFHCFPHSSLLWAWLLTHDEWGEMVSCRATLCTNPHVHIFSPLYHTTNFPSHLLGSQHWGGLFPPLPAGEMVHCFSTVQMWKQLTVIERPLQFTHDVPYKITTSKGPNHTLLGCQVLPANMQEGHHACWAVKIQMVGSRWVMNAMLFPLTCTQLPQDDHISGTTQVGGNLGTCALMEIVFRSKQVPAT